MNDEAVTTAEPRRNVLSALVASAISLVLGLVPFGAGLMFFLDPVVRRRTAESGEAGAAAANKDADGFIRMSIGADALPEDGPPQQYTVLDDKIDAWNMFPQVPIGSVWLRRTEDGQILAFNTVCPHLGCAVSHRTSENDFFCPCHTSAFDLNGSRKNKVPPRGMDSLDIRRKTDGVEAPDGNEIWIRFENYRAATDEKIPV